MTDDEKISLLHAAAYPDWGQVVANGGPPCFHVEEGGAFCLRACRWEGHNHGWDFHPYVSLHELLHGLLEDAR